MKSKVDKFVELAISDWDLSIRLAFVDYVLKDALKHGVNVDDWWLSNSCSAMFNIYVDGVGWGCENVPF